MELHGAPGLGVALGLIMGVFTGGSSNDVLYGTDSADTLDGGTGADTLYGGKGNDTYIVDDPGDVVVENAGEGTDLVKTTLSAYTLGANVENLSFTGIGGFYGTGNGLSNLMTASSPLATLAGGAGDDFYQVSNSATTIVELANGGRDTVIATSNYALPANVETLRIYGLGPNGGYTGVGNSGDNVLGGDANAHTLIGLGGNDTLTGGGGHDTFVFDVGSGHDVLTDWNTGDVIRLGAGYGVTNYTQLFGDLTQTGANVVLTVVGHSLGGVMALELALDHGDHVGKVMIVDSLAFYTQLFAGPQATAEGAKPYADAMGQKLLASSDADFAKGAAQTGAMMATAQPDRDRIAAWSIASARPVMVTAMQEDMTTDLRPRLASIAVPVTVIYEAPLKALMEADYGSAKQKTLVSAAPDAKHFIMYDDPAGFDAALDTFLKG